MAQSFGDLSPSKYPGERLGLPANGSGSIAKVGPRLLALAIDWALAAVPAYVLIGGPAAMWWHPLCFALINAIFIPTIGGSPGHRVCRMYVVPLGGGWVGIWRPLVRSLLLIAVLPPLVWDSDQRGFHDKIAGTVLLRI